MSSKIQNDYFEFGYSGHDRHRKINLDALNTITYSSPSRTFFESFGRTTTILSALTTAVIAPLVSINYKNGGFNKNRYYTVAGCGLIGLSGWDSFDGILSTQDL